MDSLSSRHRLYLACETLVVAGGLMVIAFFGRTWTWLPQMPVLGASWLLVVYMLGLVGWLRMRGESPATYGLFKPTSWGQVFGVAAVMLVLMYAYLILVNPYVLEWLKPWIGSGVNLTRFDGLRNNGWLYLEILPMVWLSAGLTEEFLFRGFLFNRLLTIFGRGPLPFVLAAVIETALFSIGHIYQGWPGVVGIAAISLFLLVASRLLKGNLWPAIIMHGLLDSISLAILVARDHLKP